MTVGVKKYFINYSVPGTVLRAGEAVGNRIKHIPALSEFMFYKEETKQGNYLL